MIRGQLDFPLEIARTDEFREDGEPNDELIVEGVAATTEPQSDGLMLTQRALDASVSRFMEFPNLFSSHDMSTAGVVGKVLELTPIKGGLRARARISDAEPGIKTKIREGLIKAFSVGFRVLDGEFRELTEEEQTFEVSEMELIDVSLAPLPLDRGATFSVAREARLAELREKFSPPVATPEVKRGVRVPLEVMLAMAAATSALQATVATDL